MFVFFFKQKTAYEMRISDWSSDVCSSDLLPDRFTQWSSAVLATGSSLWIFMIMGLVCADILMRSIFNSPLQGVPEIVAYSVPGCVFLAVTFAIRSGRFLRADFIFAGVVARYPRAGSSEEHTSELPSLMRLSY